MFERYCGSTDSSASPAGDSKSDAKPRRTKFRTSDFMATRWTPGFEDCTVCYYTTANGVLRLAYCTGARRGDGEIARKSHDFRYGSGGRGIGSLTTSATGGGMKIYTKTGDDGETGLFGG